MPVGPEKLKSSPIVHEEHPPLSIRIEYSMLFVEMWCREVGAISTSWMTDGTLKEYFGVASIAFGPEEVEYLKGTPPPVASDGRSARLNVNSEYPLSRRNRVSSKLCRSSSAGAPSLNGSARRDIF